MRFNDHWNLEGRHAFLSPSNYHWINYSDEKLEERYKTYRASERGTRLHNLAKECIELGIKMPKNKNTFNMYVNDAIGFKMTPEQPLYFSDNCFGTADAISFRKKFLRIHDLKTGVSPVSMLQLETYAALFFLEYGVEPADTAIELRIYQEPEVIVHTPDILEVYDIMEKIQRFDKVLTLMQEDI